MLEGLVVSLTQYAYQNKTETRTKGTTLCGGEVGLNVNETTNFGSSHSIFIVLGNVTLKRLFLKRSFVAVFLYSALFIIQMCKFLIYIFCMKVDNARIYF